MASPYSSTSVSGYNANPPPDDGTAVSTNLVTWAMVKTKLGDPLNVFDSAVNSALVTAFGKTLSGASVVNTAIAYPAGAADQGRLIRTTAAGVVVTTPDATSVSAPFVFAVLNNSSGGASIAGFGGTQTIDGALSTALAAGAGVFLFTDGSNWFTAGQSSTTTPIIPQGRLTLVSGTPVMSADQAAATAVYYTPYIGNQIPIPNGSVFKANTFAELTLTLNNTNYIANTIYDVFVALNPADNATVVVGTGPAWSNSAAGTGARGSGAGTTEIARSNGLLWNNNAITLRNNATTYAVATKSAVFVGSIFVDGTNGQVTCHFSYGASRKFGLWNAYNRVKTILQAGDPTASWSYNSGTIRQSNAATGNKVTTFTGLAEEWAEITFQQAVEGASSTNTPLMRTGIGLNVTNAFSGTRGQLSMGTTTYDILKENNAKFDLVPGLGINNLNACEAGSASNPTFYGTQTDMLLKAVWMA